MCSTILNQSLNLDEVDYCASSLIWIIFLNFQLVISEFCTNQWTFFFCKTLFNNVLGISLIISWSIHWFKLIYSHTLIRRTVSPHWNTVCTYSMHVSYPITAFYHFIIENMLQWFANQMSNSKSEILISNLISKKCFLNRQCV